MQPNAAVGGVCQQWGLFSSSVSDEKCTQFTITQFTNVI